MTVETPTRPALRAPGQGPPTPEPAPRPLTLDDLGPEMRARYERIARENHCTVADIQNVMGLVTKEQLLDSFVSFYGVEPMAFSEGVPIPIKLLELFTPAYLKAHRAVPVGEEAGQVVVLMENPRDLTTLDDLASRLGGRKIRVKVAIREDIFRFIDLFYGGPSPRESAAPMDVDEIVRLMDFQAEAAAPAAAADEPEAREDEAGIVRLVNQVIEQACTQGASDIHIEPDPDEDTVVRFRVDGLCREYTRVPRRYARAIVSRIKIMSGLDIAERRLPQDGKIKYKVGGTRPLELRVATMPTQGEIEDVVMRLLASSRPIPLDQIGLRPENRAAFERIVARPYGLILCVGPTGSGKTTTLHSAIATLNAPQRKVWTVEDPVEITQRGIRQVQVHRKIGLTFERVLRGFLRADPNVIMVGEMRDVETASVAVEASLTGHLVLSTLHTNNAPETVTRLLDMGLDPFSFGDSLLGVLAQRLVRTLCGGCARSVPASADEREAIEREFEEPEAWRKLGVADPRVLALGAAGGCAVCGGSGYKGRMGIHELMVVGDEIRQLIYRKAEAARMREVARRDGMWTLKQDGILKAIQGRTDLREVRRVASG